MEVVVALSGRDRDARRDADGEKRVEFAEFRATVKRVLRELHCQVRRGADRCARLSEPRTRPTGSSICREVPVCRLEVVDRGSWIAVRWSAGRILTGKEWNCVFRFSG
jgi:hypothetical protein